MLAFNASMRNPQKCSCVGWATTGIVAHRIGAGGQEKHLAHPTKNLKSLLALMLALGCKLGLINFVQLNNQKKFSLLVFLLF